jgi:hypothetical protein
MRIFEITTPLRSFTATVRIHTGNRRITLRTQVQADGITQARTLLQHLYGVGNVLSVM